MSEYHRIRKKQFHLSLLEEEMQILSDKAKTAGMSKTEFLRNVILFGSARGRTNFTREDAKSLIYELNRIGNNINQIAYQANVNCAVNKNDFHALTDYYDKLLAQFSALAGR